MDIAVLSDIHGNYIALKRCMEYAFDRGIGTFIFLGDYLGDLPYPERTMQLIYELKEKYRCLFLRGNKEDYWLNYRKYGERSWKDNDSTTGMLLYTYSSLRDDDLLFFSQMKIAQEFTLDKLPTILLCHGSPYINNVQLLPNEPTTMEILDELRVSLIVCGHSHVQCKFEYNGKYVLNPGSVGMPLHSNSRTQFMILHGDAEVWTEEFISLEYDIDKVINLMQEAGLYEHAPLWSRISEYTLRKGDISHGLVIERAIELCREDRGQCQWPNIAEKYWQQAIREMLPI